ncbi:MAG: 16S rRNA processing protein RimM [Firmicutes bacterium HGW-Firmicutes-15]|nr:MAG: 16S rRNA processing protein RimM [Firmicutes bacterium HGW-Firmicutes-15]
MESQELIKIGKINGTHGYKGAVKVELLTDFPQRFKNLQKVKISQKNTVVELTIESCNSHQGKLLIKFKGIDSIEEAVKYRNAYLNVSADEIYPLPEGSFYHFQLIGMKVYDLEIGYLGQLIDIIETGANDVYVIKSDVYEEILIPAIKEVIREVDLASMSMHVKLLPGLLEVKRER